MLVGTPIYMPPEQILNPDVDGRADIYATGTMLFEMLIPEPLFPKVRSVEELFNMKLNQEDRLFPKRPSELNPKIHEEMDEILFKALAHDPEKRYATCPEFREQLEGYRDRYLRN